MQVAIGEGKTKDVRRARRMSGGVKKGALPMFRQQIDLYSDAREHGSCGVVDDVESIFAVDRLRNEFSESLDKSDGPLGIRPQPYRAVLMDPSRVRVEKLCACRAHLLTEFNKLFMTKIVVAITG